MSTIAAPDRSPANILAFGFRAEPDRRNLGRGPWEHEPRHLQSGGRGRDAGAGARGRAGAGGRGMRRRRPSLPWLARTPAPDRAHVLFKFRELLEKNFSDVAHSIVRENGKLLSEARGSLRRGLDVVEFACGIPSQLMGQTLTDVSRDVDCHHHPRTYGRGGRHSAVQFPGLDSAVDDVGRRRLREHVPPQACREGTAHRHPTRGDVRRCRLAAGRRRRGAGEQGGQRTAHRQPACPGGFLRRHVCRGGVGLPHRGGSRQACSGARRSEEPSARPARCRPGAASCPT